MAAAPDAAELEAKVEQLAGRMERAARTARSWRSICRIGPATDEDLKLLAAAPDLQRLLLWGPGITDAGLAHLASLDKLTDLGLDNTMVSDAGLAQVGGARRVSRRWCSSVRSK